jgi:hypothetical protein
VQVCIGAFGFTRMSKQHFGGATPRSTAQHHDMPPTHLPPLVPAQPCQKFRSRISALVQFGGKRSKLTNPQDSNPEHF